MKAAGVTVNEVNVDDFKSRVGGVYEELGLVEAREALQPYIDAAK